MIDTNTLWQIAPGLDPRPSTLATFNAWHVVALGAGAYLAHAYHSIKAAGGIKNIFRGLWEGDQSPQSTVRSPQSENQPVLRSNTAEGGTTKQNL